MIWPKEAMSSIWGCYHTVFHTSTLHLNVTACDVIRALSVQLAVTKMMPSFVQRHPQVSFVGLL